MLPRVVTEMDLAQKQRAVFLNRDRTINELINFVDGKSTTGIIEKILQQNREERK
jgi:hypothetical protein